jgi:PPOX class probable F420-dependent enzyme
LNKKYINIETYKKNGQAVRTPVWFIVDNAKIYSRTDLNSGKVKRARNNAHARVAPCDARGRAMGKWVDGEIRIANISESEQVNQLLNQKYGLQGRLVRTFNKLRKTRPIVICVEI